MERYYKCLNPKGWVSTIKDNDGYLIFDMKTFVCKWDSFTTNEYRIIWNYDNWQESTKEEYEAQFEWKLPEKWCIKVTEKTIPFLELHREYGYLKYIIDGYVCFDLNEFIFHSRETSIYTEITLEQFKKYVLKLNNNKEMNNIEKPRIFAIHGKEHQLRSIWKDLEEIGYKESDSFKPTGDIKWNTLAIGYDKKETRKSEYIKIGAFIDKCNVYEIHYNLPQDYQKALDYAKEAIESEYWEENRKSKFVKGDFIKDNTSKQVGIVENSDNCFVYFRSFKTESLLYINYKINKIDNITEQEYKDTLLAYAREKYPVGIKIISTTGKKGSINYIGFGDNYPKDLISFCKSNKMAHEDNRCIYDASINKWAEIIPQTKINIGDYTPDFNNKGYVKFGCCEITKDEIDSIIKSMSILGKIRESAGVVILDDEGLSFTKFEDTEYDDYLDLEELEEIKESIK